MADATRACFAPAGYPWGFSPADACLWRPILRGVRVAARQYYLVPRTAVALGTCEPQPTDPHQTRCVRGLPICHEHADCRRSLALGVACAEGRC